MGRPGQPRDPIPFQEGRARMRWFLGTVTLLALCHAQVLEDAVEPDLQKLLVRTGSASSLASHFGETHTLDLHADTLAGGAFLPHTPACASGGCILDARMAGQLVEWFGNYEWTLKYAGSKDGFASNAFQSKMSNQPTITVIYSRQTNAETPVDRGTYIFGGYTTKSWLATDHTKRCADAGNGGTNTVNACDFWSACSASSDCTGYSQCGCCTASGGTDCGAGQACTTGACTAGTCACCADNTCETVCSHVADSKAAVFTLMADGVHAFNRYGVPGTATGEEIFTCSTYGPAFGGKSTGGKPPYVDADFAIKTDLGDRGGSIGTYGFTGMTDATWATGHATEWRINEIEVYGISSWTTGQSLFQYAPKGGTSGGDASVYVWYRNTITSTGGFDSWNFKKRVVPPSWADSHMYGFSVAVDANTLVVGRRGNRDIFIHDRHKSDCTQTGNSCSDRGSYSADNWGLVQTLSWPGSRQNNNYFGNVWPETYCSSVTACHSQATATVLPFEWGCSVALKDTILVVGAYKSKRTNANTGAAFAYKRNQNGDFRYEGTLSSSTTAHSHCGWDVATDGTYVISGCYGKTDVAGKVEFYERNPVDGSSTSSPWAFVASRTATTCSNPPSCTSQSDAAAAGDFFGYSVDISGSTAVVGSFGASTNTGAAYVFERGFDTVFDGTTSNLWRLSKKLVAPDASTDSYFGFSVALDGSYALISSLKENAGKGYLFIRNYGGVNNWGYVKELSQPAIGTGSLLYTSNAGAKHSVNYWSDGPGTAARADGAQLLHLTPDYNDYAVTSNAESANFGSSAKISGNTVAIGAPFADISNNDVGAVSLFQINPTWRQSKPSHMEQTLSGGDVAGGDEYGASLHVTSDNRYTIVGAPHAHVSGKMDAGAVYLLARNASGAFGQYAKLEPDDPEEFAYFGTSVSSVDVIMGDTNEYALAEVIVGAPGKTNVNYPEFPKQHSAGQTQPASGAVYVFSQQPGYAFTTLSTAITPAQVASQTDDQTITVTSSTNLLGGATTGTIYIGMNSITVLSVNGNVLTVKGSTITRVEPVGTRVIGERSASHRTKGFAQVEKLTAQSTSCGQGGLDFAGVWNQYSEANSAQTHVSDYSAGATLVQPLHPGDTEICVSSAKALLGAFYVGGTAPYVQGDPSDVIAYIKIDTNPAVALKNSVTTGTCAPAAGQNQWTTTYAGDTIKILPTSVTYAYPCSNGAASCTSTTTTTNFIAGSWAAVQIYKAPYFTVMSPYTSCLDGEYVTMGRLRGGMTTIATDANAAVTDRILHGYSFTTGSSTVTVTNALELFKATLWGKIKTSSSTTKFQLPDTASNVKDEYIGYSITVDLDGNIGTTSDVETRLISEHLSNRYVTVASAFTIGPDSDSIFVLSRWQQQPFIATMSNLKITVTGVNFFTNVLTVSGISVAGFPGDAVYQVAPSTTEIQLESTTPDIDHLYIKCTIKIVQGKGAGQVRTVTAYNGRTQTATVSPAWTIQPDSTSEYVITGKPLCVNNCEKDGFGFSLANGRHERDRHLMAVGAPWADSHSYCRDRSITTGLCTTVQSELTEGGRVYLFERHGNSTQNRWRLTSILEAPATTSALETQGAASAMSILELTTSTNHKATHFMHFGWSLAIRDETIFVGVPRSGAADEGAVYVYERNYHVLERGTVICTTACTTTSFSIGTLSGTSPDNTPRPNALAYVSYVVTIDDQTRTISGYSVQTSGEAIITVSSAFKTAPSVNAPYVIHAGHDSNGLSNKWGYKETVTSSSSSSSDLFGWAIAVASQTLVVGAPECNVPLQGLTNALTGAGSVFVFEESSGSTPEGRESRRWTESQRLIQTSKNSWNSNLGTKIGKSVAIDIHAENIIAGGPLQDAESYASDTNFVYTQKQGFLPSAGSMGIWRKQPEERFTFVATDFAEKATSITVLSASAIFVEDSTGTISIGKNRAIMVTAVNFATNVLTVNADTVVFSHSRIADGFERAHVVRKWYWRKDMVYTPSTAVAGGKAGMSVALWNGGIAFYGAPDAEMDTACCGSTHNIKIRGGVVHTLTVSRSFSTRDYQGVDIESGTIVEVVSGTSDLQLALDNSSSKLEDYYLGYNMMIDHYGTAETRRIVKYTGSTRLATVDSAFTTVPSPDAITSIAISSGGSGYTNNVAATASCTGVSGCTGSGFSGTCTVATGVVTAIVTTNSGSGYLSTAPPSIVCVSGIASFTITSAGTGYTNNGALTVTCNPPCVGTGLAGTCQSDAGNNDRVTGITVTNQGSGYSVSDPPAFACADGTGGTFTPVFQGAGLTAVPTVGSTYRISDYVYTFSGVINSEHAPGTSCRSILEDGYTQSGYYWLQTAFSDTSFIGFCDQDTDGGGWLICYTDDNEVDLAEEYAFHGAFPYGRSGYRSNCRDYPFNQVQYILHFQDYDFNRPDDRVIFRAEGRRPIMASNVGWEGNPVDDAYGKLTFTVDSPDPVPDKSIPYQLLICASGRTSGFFMSGLQPTSDCPSSWKTCSNWCKDKVSEYYRHAYSPRENRNNGVHANFTGVIFRENGHRAGSRKLMSVGIRTAGSNCMSGWEGDGTTCTCTAASSANVVAYWRFENGLENQDVHTLIEDTSIRTAATYSSDTRLPSALGSGAMVTTSRNNDLEFVTGSAPMYTRWVPKNQSFAILCLQNTFALEFGSSKFVRTTDYAVINSMTFNEFTWEMSVYHNSLSNKQTYLSWHDAGGTYFMCLQKNANNRLEFSVKTSSSTIAVTSRFSLALKTWHHVAVTYDGGVAGQLRLYYLDPYGSAVTGSDCADDTCLRSETHLIGTIGERGAGLGFGVSKLSGTLAGCTVGMTLSAYGGGICDTGYVGNLCTFDSDCGGGLITGTCKVGSGFAATITAVSSGSITEIYITDPGEGYSSNPKLVVSSGSCTCAGAAGNVQGSMDTCLISARNTGINRRKSHWVEDQAADVSWSSMAGWANDGDTSACTASSPAPCPFVSDLSSTPGWRWSIGRDGANANYLTGLVDEIRVSSSAIALPYESLWRP